MEQEVESPLMMDKDTNLLTKVAANHLFLTQFEAFRATILSLRHRNPNLALSFLQTIVVNGGNFKNVIYSTNCSSPALLTWLTSLELFQFENSTSIWSDSLSADSLRVRVEFLLYIQMVSSRVSDSVERVSEMEEEEVEEKLKELKGCMHLLDEIMELGLRRLKEDLIVSLGEEREVGDVEVVVREDELGCLRRVILKNADVFVSLCENIQRQVEVELEKDDGNGLAITLRREGRVGTVSSEEDQRLLKSIQKCVQLSHLDEMRQCVNKEAVDWAISHIRYLHFGYGVPEEEYRMVFQELLQKVVPGYEGEGHISRPTRDKLLHVYREALSSKCTHLVKMLQMAWTCSSLMTAQLVALSVMLLAFQ
ncbi:Modification methylase Rho11sI [Bienertia sinuspersici]